MTSCPEEMGWEFEDLKNTTGQGWHWTMEADSWVLCHWVEIWIWPIEDVVVFLLISTDRDIKHYKMHLTLVGLDSMVSIVRIMSLFPRVEEPNSDCPVTWGCRIHWLHLCRGVKPPLKSVLDMSLNNLMVRFQQWWSFVECGVPIHCHRS